VAPSKEAAKNGTYVPLSRPLFIYINAKAMDKPEVKAFVDFYLTEANLHSLVDEVGYIPYPATTNGLVRKRWADRKHGSSFQGKTAGKAIDDLINGPMMFAD
jgi:phosphate transport system substrate-binding protein